MKKTIIFYLVIGLFLSACNLDRFPLDRPSDLTFLSNEAELETAAVGCYQAFWYNADGSNYIGIYPMLDVVTDIGWERGDLKFQQIGAGIHDSNNSFASATWARAYLAIARCNYLLVNMVRAKQVVQETKYNRIAAEAKFIRAYWYMLLTELYGDVPLILEPQTLENVLTPKTNKQTIVEQLLVDLTDAALALPKTVSATERGRVTKGAALALKARIALYNEKWDIAAKAADDCIKLDVYDLDKNYEDLFNNAGQTVSEEIIFDVQYDKSTRFHGAPSHLNTRMTKGYSTKIPTQSLVDSYECTDGKSIDESPLYDSSRPFDNRDPRLKYTIVVPGDIFGGYQFETHKDSLKCWNYNTSPATRVDNQDATNAYASFSGYCWKKYSYMEDNDALFKSQLGFIILRYADVLLMYAEAKTELDEIDITVYNAINDVRNRVNMPSLSTSLSREELRNAIRRERKYELSLEGHRLFDIRRWRIAETVMPGKLYGRIPRGLLSNAPIINDIATPDYNSVMNKGNMRIIENRVFDKERDYLLPIPRLETETNTLLTQNPFY